MPTFRFIKLVFEVGKVLSDMLGIRRPINLSLWQFGSNACIWKSEQFLPLAIPSKGFGRWLMLF